LRPEFTEFRKRQALNAPGESFVKSVNPAPSRVAKSSANESSAELPIAVKRL
jgi:hypothetical protein